MGLTGRLVSLPAGAMQISYKLAGKALYKNFPPSSNVAETQNTSSVPLRVSTWGCKKISKGCKYAATALHKESSLRETTDESSSSAPESALSSLTVSNEVEQDETEEVKGLLDVSEENSIRWVSLCNLFSRKFMLTNSDAQGILPCRERFASCFSRRSPG